MVALVNAERIAERFGDISSALLTLPPGSEVGYEIVESDGDSDAILLAPVPNPDDGSVEIELVKGRQIIAGLSFNELSGGLLASMSAFSGLYSKLMLTDVVLRGQIGGVYVVFNFKAV